MPVFGCLIVNLKNPVVLQDIGGGVPRKADYIGKTENFVLVVLQPLFGERVPRIPTAQFTRENFIISKLLPEFPAADYSIPGHFRADAGCTHHLVVLIGFRLNHDILHYCFVLFNPVPNVLFVPAWISHRIDIDIGHLESLGESASDQFDSCVV